jgi:hypothetical protein
LLDPKTASTALGIGVPKLQITIDAFAAKKLEQALGSTADAFDYTIVNKIMTAEIKDIKVWDGQKWDSKMKELWEAEWWPVPGTY